MRVYFDNLFADFAHVSLNKKKESLCGDFYIMEERGSDTVLVLSDGLGSGVKANILATLTAKMLCTMMIKKIHLEEAVRTADLVITGEGRMDAQTLMGKTPAGVARLAKKYAVPVIAYAGCFGDGIEQCTESGLFDRVYAVTEQEGAFDPQMAVRDLGQKVRETMSEWIHMIDTKKGANE